MDSLQADVKKEKVLLEQGEVRTYTRFLEEVKEKVGCFLIFSLFLCCSVGIVQLSLCITRMSYFGDCIPIYNTRKLPKKFQIVQYRKTMVIILLIGEQL